MQIIQGSLSSTNEVKFVYYIAEMAVNLVFAYV